MIRDDLNLDVHSNPKPDKNFKEEDIDPNYYWAAETDCYLYLIINNK